MCRQYKLLLAEDEDHVRNGILTYMQLNAPCFEKVYAACDGREALDMIYKYKPDIMLLDIQMPYRDGLEVMAEANKAGICPKTIILSGYDEFRYAQQAIRNGAEDYLLKPCRPAEILDKIKIMMNIRDIQNEKSEEEGRNRFVEMAKEYIQEHYMEDITLPMVAEKAQVTSAYLSTLFTQTTGTGFIDYLNRVRVERACSYLDDSSLKAYEVAYRVGFKDEKYFTKVFKKLMGVTPSGYRKEQMQ